MCLHCRDLKFQLQGTEKGCKCLQKRFGFLRLVIYKPFEKSSRGLGIGKDSHISGLGEICETDKFLVLCLAIQL